MKSRMLKNIGSSKLPSATSLRMFRNLLDKGVSVMTDKYVVVLMIIYVVLFFAIGRPFVTSDGWGYYAVLSSVVEDQSVTIKDPDRFSPYTPHIHQLEDGRNVSPYSHGAAILWSPFYIFFKFLEKVNFIPLDQKFDITFGTSIGEGVSLLIGTVFYSFLSLLFVYKLLSLYFKKPIAFISTGSTAMSMFYFEYTFNSPTFVHVHETFLIIFAYYLYISNIRYKAVYSNRRLLVIGLLIGLAASCRAASIVFFFPIAALLLFNKSYRNLFVLIVGVSISASTIFVYNYLMYGDPLLTGFKAIGGDPAIAYDPQKYNFFFQLLFHPVRGLFWWSPMLILSGFGFIPLIYNKNIDRSTLFILFTSFLFLLIFYSFWMYWWAGYCLGQRFLISSMPTFAFGTASFLSMFDLSFNGFQKRFLQIFSYSLISLGVLFSIFTYHFYSIFPLYTLQKPDTDSSLTIIPPSERFTVIDPYILAYNHFELWKIGGYQDALVSFYNYDSQLSRCPMGRLIYQYFTEANDIYCNKNIIQNKI